jgi:hypothetical protein
MQNLSSFSRFLSLFFRAIADGFISILGTLFHSLIKSDLVAQFPFFSSTNDLAAA